MREIKFKYLVVFESGEVKKTILTLEEIEKNSEFSSFGQAIANVANGVKEIYRRQYTGLKDKNGAEIYEGDILSVDNADRIVKVSWFDIGATFDTKFIKSTTNSEFPVLHNSDLGRRAEVVGNIFENPELLESV